MQMLKKRMKRGEGDIMGKVAKQMNIKRSSVYYWQKLVNLSSNFEKWYEDGQISLKTAAKIAGYPEEIQNELWNQKNLVSNERIQKLPAEVSIDEFTDKFMDILTEEELERTYEMTANIVGIEDMGTYNIRISEAPPDDTPPLVIYAPAKIVEEIRRKYKRYIVSEYAETAQDDVKREERDDSRIE